MHSSIYLDLTSKLHIITSAFFLILNVVKAYLQKQGFMDTLKLFTFTEIYYRELREHLAQSHSVSQTLRRKKSVIFQKL